MGTLFDRLRGLLEQASLRSGSSISPRTLFAALAFELLLALPVGYGRTSKERRSAVLSATYTASNARTPNGRSTSWNGGNAEEPPTERRVAAHNEVRWRFVCNEFSIGDLLDPVLLHLLS